MAKQTKGFGVYHWDNAEEYVIEKYKGRISTQGADQVDIVDLKGEIIGRYKVK
jgi:hypothetical protein